MLEKSSGTVKILDCLKSKVLWSYMSTLNFKVPPPCQSSPKMLEYACVCQKTAAKSRKSPNLPVRFPKSLAAVYAVLMSRNLSDDYKWKIKTSVSYNLNAEQQRKIYTSTHSPCVNFLCHLHEIATCFRKCW